MKPIALFSVLILVAISMAMAQDKPAAKLTAAKNPQVVESTTVDQVEGTLPLDELAWMVGRWVDKDGDSTITTTCSWTTNRKFLKRSFKIKAGRQVTLDGTQFVGWDPIASQIRSWTFDSEGGFGEGRWIRDGSRWLVKTSFVLPDGRRASALNVITYVDPNTLRWQSTNREIGGDMQPNIPEVTVVREKTAGAGKEVVR